MMSVITGREFRKPIAIGIVGTVNENVIKLAIVAIFSLDNDNSCHSTLDSRLP